MEQINDIEITASVNNSINSNDAAMMDSQNPLVDMRDSQSVLATTDDADDDGDVHVDVGNSLPPKDNGSQESPAVDSSDRFTSQDLEATFKRFEDSATQSQSQSQVRGQKQSQLIEDNQTSAGDQMVQETDESISEAVIDNSINNNNNNNNNNNDNDNDNNTEAADESADLTNEAQRQRYQQSDDIPTSKKSRVLKKSQIKRFTSVWVLFQQDERKKVQQQLPGLNTRELSKELANRYHALNDEQREHYNALVRADRERYEQEIAAATVDDEDDAEEGEEEDAAGDDNDDDVDAADATEGTKGYRVSTQLAFPLTRIKRTVKLDPEVRNVGKDALSLICKATELFCGFLARRCVHASALRGAKSVKEADLIQAIFMTENLDFLRLDFPRKPTAAATSAVRNAAVAPRFRLTADPVLKLQQQQQQHQDATTSNSNDSNSGSSNIAAAVKSIGSKRAAEVATAVAGGGIRDFFRSSTAAEETKFSSTPNTNAIAVAAGDGDDAYDDEGDDLESCSSEEQEKLSSVDATAVTNAKAAVGKAADGGKEKDEVAEDDEAMEEIKNADTPQKL